MFHRLVGTRGALSFENSILALFPENPTGAIIRAYNLIHTKISDSA